jgi:hypothetical protein
MRTVRDLRLAGLIAYLAALVGGLIVSGIIHVLLGSGGRLGWNGFNFWGMVEGICFILFFTLTLWISKRAVKVTTTTLLSAGIFAPTSAKRLAKPIPTTSSLQSFEGGVAVLLENDAPVGIIGVADSLIPWEEAPVVSGETAASEIGGLFRQHATVFVADNNTIHGMISRESYFRYLGVK